ncbi:hypothetical protein JTE90_009064 [Oedothorax gibbosus]|uniref:Uncharacterized protein n=1 Tax=Oedothorax gibbosus TaxID=931172 RepID=A0AAV6V288_9ARAC|nr:hypothetical protein JTE90_009064 [Oedothorax gibbosus]
MSWKDQEIGSRSDTPGSPHGLRRAERVNLPVRSQSDRVMAASRYTPQVDDTASYVEGPPPAYTKGFSAKIQYVRLAAKTIVCLIALIGAFVLLAAYIHSTTPSCACPDEFSQRLDAEPLIAEPSTKTDFKLHIGEDLRVRSMRLWRKILKADCYRTQWKKIEKAKNKQHLNCLVEKNEQVLDAEPPRGQGKLLVKDLQTLITCTSEPGKKRMKRSAPCECQCAC